MISDTLDLPKVDGGECHEKLRGQVRTFLDEQRHNGFTPGVDTWLGGFDPQFSAMLGQRGWLGMTWPTRYGGHERSGVERFVVIEELLAAGAPVAAHWFADRQVGPSLLRFGTETQRQEFLPPIARGECFFAIGMSEPDSGSDLASVKTRATPVAGGWEVSGAKVWTSGAHRSHYLLALVRTGPGKDDGLTQVIIDLHSAGVEVRPILLLTGEHHFNEVLLDSVFVPHDRVLGAVGNGWAQVNSELAYERSGPERVLSVAQLVLRFAEHAAHTQCPEMLAALGQIFARMWAVRQMSLRIAAGLDDGREPALAAALVKDYGTRFEQDCLELLRKAAGELAPGTELDRLLWRATMHSPGFTLRGGTSEILRLIAARGLI